VGLAMGTTASEVIPQVADMTLSSNDLRSLVSAVREGRTVQQDIKKAVDYILTQNFAEILFTLLSVSAGLGVPLNPMQYLWMNLVTDIFPELALAREPAERDILSHRPVNAEDRLF